MRPVLLAAALLVSVAATGCILVPVPHSARAPQSAQPAGDEDDDSTDDPDDEVGIYGDHVDDETGVYMGPDCEPTGSSDDGTTDYPE